MLYSLYIRLYSIIESLRLKKGDIEMTNDELKEMYELEFNIYVLKLAKKEDRARYKKLQKKYLRERLKEQKNANTNNS